MTTRQNALRAAMAEHAKAERADDGGPAPAPALDAPPAAPRARRQAGAGRPPVDPAAKRSGQRISVYVTEAEHAALEAAAARAGLSASAWARMALLAAADTRPGA